MFTTEKTSLSKMPVSAKKSQNMRLLGHDIRSALSGVLGGLSLFDIDDLSRENKDHFERAQTAAQMILQLLNGAAGILGVVTDEANGDQPISLNDRVQKLKSRWRGEAVQNGISLDFIVPEQEITVGLSELDFERIFNNLLSNAIKFTKAGQIFLEFSVENKQLIAKISDSGPGFSARALERLFEYKSRPEEEIVDGSGMGLFIVKSLTEKAGGTIVARNSTGVGAVLTVTLPITSSPTKKPAASTGLPDLSHLKILMAEDNLTNQMVANQMLKAMNATCVLASDGVEAMEMFDAEEFDLCLIDIEMPRMSGLEVMRNIRGRSDARAATPLIALTAYVLPEHQERINAAGADGLISKPLTNISEFGLSILAFSNTATALISLPETKSATGDGGCIDFTIYDGLAEMIGQDSMQELLGKVKTDIETVKSGMADGLKSQDNDAIGSNTHILISVAGAIGAVDLQMQAQALNSLSKTSNWKEITVSVKNCVSGCSDVLAFVESRL